MFLNLQKFEFQTTKKITGIGGESTLVEDRRMEFKSLEECLAVKFTGLEKRWKRSNHYLFYYYLMDTKWYLKYGRYATLKDQEELLKFKNDLLIKINVDPKFLGDDKVMELVRLRDVEFMPCCAIVGGFLTQEVLKCLTKKEVPLNNFCCYEGAEQQLMVMKL